ncbi:AAC(3) family N-acetyltransferase [Thermodesulfobacteriota bacterium]
MKEIQLFTDSTKTPVTNHDLLRSLEAVGAAGCEVLYIHSELSFGAPSLALGRKGVLDGVLTTIKELGVPTLCVPTFTFSFCNGVDYDVDKSKSKMGAFNEYFRVQSDALRSVDPLMSNAIIGKNKGLVANIGHESVGHRSTFDILHKCENVSFLFFGIEADMCFTYLHYVEYMLNTPYRYNRKFTGMITDGDRTYEDSYTLFVRYNGVVPKQNLRIGHELEKRGALRRTMCGDGTISCVGERDTFEIISEKISNDQEYMVEVDHSLFEKKDTTFHVENMVAL